MGRGWTALVVVFAVALTGACGGGDETPSPPPSSTTTSLVRGPASLFTLHPVLAVDSPPCRAEATPLQGEQACLWLGDAAVNGDDVASAIVESQRDVTGEQPVLQVRFTASGLERLNALAAAQRGKQIALVVDGTLVSAPSVATDAFTDSVSFVGLTRAEAERVAAAFPQQPGS